MMKSYLKLFLFAVVLMSCGVRASAQDIHFSQFYENAVLRNPALVGIYSGDYKVGADYRNQWGSIAAPFQTALISGEARIVVNREIGDYISFGLAASYDKAGSIDFTSVEVYPAINYNKALEDVHNTYLSVGLTGGYIARTVDMSKATFSSQYVGGNYSSSNPTGENAPFKSLTNYDVGAGVSLNSSIGTENKFNYYFGAALYHINRPTEVFNGAEVLVKLPMKWEGNLGFHSALSDQWGITVHLNYSDEQPYQEYIGGILATWRTHTPGLPSTFALSAGVFYRYQDAIIPTVKVDYQNTSIGFSYDVNTSGLKTVTSGTGGYEITLYMRGNFKHNLHPGDNIKCPHFEDDVNSAFK